MKKLFKIELFMAIILLGSAFVYVYSLTRPWSIDYSDKYTTDLRAVESVVISGSPEVRSEPLAAERHYTVYAGTEAGAAGFGVESKAVEDSYGPVDGSNGPITLTRVTDVEIVTKSWYDDMSAGDTIDGPYIGFYVDDITPTNEGWAFPEEIRKDPDHIIWVSSKYLEIKYKNPTQ